MIGKLGIGASFEAPMYGPIGDRGLNACGTRAALTENMTTSAMKVVTRRDQGAPRSVGLPRGT